jgi:hypothetical protein
MSPLQQSFLISGSIFAVVMATQYGRRDYSLKALARPLVMCAVIGYIYLQGAPTQTVDYVVYAVGALIGAFLGVVAYLNTRVEREPSGQVKTICGLGFVAVWVAAVALRIAFIALSEHNQAFRAHLGRFMAAHQILESAIAPFFVLMALAMVAVRVGLLARRVSTLPAAAVPAAELVAAR